MPKLRFVRHLTLPVAALALLAALPLGCAFRQPTARIESVRLAGIDFSGVTTDFDVIVSNPNRIGLSLDGFDYEFELDGRPFISGEQENEIRIGARTASQVTVPVTVRFRDALDAVQSAGGRDEVPYTFSGGVRLATPLGPIRIPFRHRGAVPVLRPPTVELRSLRVRSIDFSGARLEIRVRLKNPNRSRLGVRDLRWELALAGSPLAEGRMNESGVLEAGERRTVAIPFRVRFQEAGRSLHQILMGRRIDYRLRGRIRFETRYGDIGFPYDLSGSVDLER